MSEQNNNHNFPVLISVEVPNKTPDDIVRDLYLKNDTESDYIFSTKSGFWVTINEETGNVLIHGPKNINRQLLKNLECLKVGDIVGWELDSQLEFSIEFEDQKQNRFLLYYNLKKRSKKEIEIKSIGKGFIIDALNIQKIKNF